MVTTARPTMTNTPATAPLLLKKDDDPPDDEPASRAPEGLWITRVTVNTAPPEVTTPVDVNEAGIVVNTLPFESVDVILTAETAVISGALVTKGGSETQVMRVDGCCTPVWPGAGTMTVDVDCCWPGGFALLWVPVPPLAVGAGSGPTVITTVDWTVSTPPPLVGCGLGLGLVLGLGFGGFGFAVGLGLGAGLLVVGGWGCVWVTMGGATVVVGSGAALEGGGGCSEVGGSAVGVGGASDVGGGGASDDGGGAAVDPAGGLPPPELF